MSTVQNFAETVINNIERVIVGKRGTVELAVIAMLSQGHLLIEDVPGVGKTMLARSLARSPVYARYAAQRCDRGFNLQSG